MSQMFNAEAFMNTQSAGDGVMAIKRDPIPASEYTAVIDSIKPKMAGDQVACDVNWAIDDAALAEKLGLKKVTVRQTVFLDIDESGRLAVGPNKNVQLGRVREAVGQNKPGPWMLGMLVGAGPAKIIVSNDPDKKDPTLIYDNVKAVTKLAA